MTVFSNAPLQRREKIHAMVTAAVLTAVLVFTAADDSVRSVLPGCLFKRMTGLPCPSCGLTRAFHAASRLDISRAFTCHVLGPILYGGLIILLILALLRLLMNRKIIRLPAGMLRILLLLFFVLYIGVWIIGLLHAVQPPDLYT